MGSFIREGDPSHNEVGVPDRRIELVMSSLCKEIKLCWREAGVGGEGNARGARAVDFKQGT